MARTVRNPKMDSRSARLKLVERREPHWTVISSVRGGLSARRERRDMGRRLRDETGRQHYEALGAADDARDADGLTVFPMIKLKQGRTFFAETARRLAGGWEPNTGPPIHLPPPMDDYLAARERRGSKGVRADRYAANARILPVLGNIEIARLTTNMSEMAGGDGAVASAGAH